MKLAIALSTCALTLTMAASLAACSKAPPTTAPTADAAPPAAAAEASSATALAALAPVKDGKVSGALTLTQEAGGVLISGTVGNLEPGSKHGFHVHEKGDCSAADFSSAGGHFNPSAGVHGDPAAAGGHHLGDMTNLEADATGTAPVKVTISGATLHDGGPNDLVGKGVIVHAQPDDYATQPSGNSGGRIACGSIG
jgi:Cu-Zn family superoxide dismutase